MGIWCEKNIILHFIKGNKLNYGVGIFFVLISSYSQTLFPKILGKVIDILKVENFNPKLVKLTILFMLLIGIWTFINTYIWRNLVIKNGRRIEW